MSVLQTKNFFPDKTPENGGTLYLHSKTGSDKKKLNVIIFHKDTIPSYSIFFESLFATVLKIIHNEIPFRLRKLLF